MHYIYPNPKKRQMTLLRDKIDLRVVFKKCKFVQVLSHTDAKYTLHKKLSFPLKISSINVINSQETADLVTFTVEILGKLHFLCCDNVIEMILYESSRLRFLEAATRGAL